MFKPKIDTRIKVLKKGDGSIIRIIPIKENVRSNKKHKSGRFLRITYVYTLLLGVVLITLLTEDVHLNKNYYPIITLIGFLLTILSILMMVVKTQSFTKFYFLITAIFYLFLLVAGVALIVKNSINSGVILILISVIPILFNSLYFNNLKKTDIPPVRLFTTSL